MNRPGLILILGIAGLLPGAASAQTASSWFDAAECKVGMERDDRNELPSLRLRPACRLGLESTRAALQALVAENQAAAPGITEVSVFIGRVEEYPWLSEAMARAAGESPEWSSRRGRMRGAGQLVNAFAADLLANDPTLQALLPGWQLTAVSVEKVLVGQAERYLPGAGLSGRLPFDAMCWLRWRRVPAGE